MRLKKYNAESGGTDASRIRQHPFFSQLPMDTEEENRYAVEESKRQEGYNSISSVSGSVVQGEVSCFVLYIIFTLLLAFLISQCYVYYTCIGAYHYMLCIAWFRGLFFM